MYKQPSPICNYTICYYSSRNIFDAKDNGKCCISRRLYCAINQDLFLFINNKEDYDLYYLDNLLIFLSPILSLIYFIVLISFCFYYNIKIFDKQEDNIFIYNYDNYEERFKDSSFIYVIYIIFNVLFPIMISIPYVVFDFYFKILIFIISLFTKFYPIK